MDRRNFVKALTGGASLAALAACTNGQITLPPLPIQLPSNVSSLVSEVNDIISKVESLGADVGAEVTSLIGQAKSAVGSITAGGDAAGWGSTLLGILGSVAGLLPPPYNLVASAIAALLPSLAGLLGAPAPAVAARFRRRSVMSVTEAWQVIHSR